MTLPTRPIRAARPWRKNPTLSALTLLGLLAAPCLEGRAQSASTAPAAPAEPEVEATEVVEADDEIEDFVVEATIMEEFLQSLTMRTEADLSLDLLSAEDLSKFAASDVADALKRIPGVSLVGGGTGGQFAIIRGLEDRYSSTTFNGAPVPSPDPTRQSVQLDLFPSDIVSNLSVGKNFVPEVPSNSAGGSLDIKTLDYPDATTVKLTLGTGFEEEARKRFLEYDDGSTVGREADPSDIIESDVGATVGGRAGLFDREVRFKALVTHEIDYTTYQGFQETLEPEPRGEISAGGQTFVTRTGGLAKGELGLSSGRFDQTQSTREAQLTGFLGLGADLDEEGSHRVDATYFHTESDLTTVELRENGYFPGYDYTELIDATNSGDLESLIPGGLTLVGTIESRLGPNALRGLVTENPDRGALWFANFGRSTSFENERDLDIYQLNGAHDFDLLEGLKVTWAANYATTTQKETSLGMRFFYEPCGYSGSYPCAGGASPIPVPTQFPVTASALGPGTYFASGTSGGIVSSRIDVDEHQYFARADAEQDLDLGERVALNLKAGLWWEQARREVDSFFVETVTVSGRSQWLIGAPTLNQLGGTLFGSFDPASGDRNATAEASREITAGHLSARLTLFEDLDLLGGLRIEKIFIDSKNDPFTGEPSLGGRPGTFPSAYLFFDRLDNPATGETSPRPGVIYNDQLLGIKVPIDPNTGIVDLLTEEEIRSVANGEIDELKVLPSAGFAYRPIEGAVLRASYSETVARPSFREIGYYVNVQPGTDERFVGNPQLTLSKVHSIDARVEYVYGEFSDLVAFSSFYKTIDDPIESIVLRNPVDLDSGSAALFRTYFNNPNTARLFGIEVEARKTFDFVRQLGADFVGVELLDYFSIGGNFTWIDASVARTEGELARSTPFFSVVPGDDFRFSRMSRKRRLFGQPEWIGNADVTFNHPDWGTQLTLAVFAISDVLDAAGSVSLDGGGNPASLTLDRYFDSFHQLDLVGSQEIWKGVTLKVSVKNLTDTARRRIYDRRQTAQTYVERTRRQGRDWSFSIGYSVDF